MRVATLPTPEVSVAQILIRINLCVNVSERNRHFKVSEKKQACITHDKDCEGCEGIFDDDLSTLRKFNCGSEIYPKIHKLEINETCVNRSDVSNTINTATF